MTSAVPRPAATVNPHHAPRLVIVVKCWPRLSETFVAQELAALEQRGLDYEIWSLRHPANRKLHPLHEQVQARVHYLPEYLHDEVPRVLASWRQVRRLPGYINARNVFLSDYRRDRTRNRIRRFGQACVLAAEMPDSILGLYAHFIHTPSSVARYAAIMRGLPWSFSAHAKDIWTSPDWELQEKLNPQSFGASFGVTCTASGATHLRSISADPARLDLVYHGLDLSRFPVPPERATPSADTATNLLSVGRLVEKKGFDNLIAALARLPQSLNWHWVHIGGGALKETLTAQAVQLQIEHNITWLGECEQPEVIQAMRDADIFILPSRIAADGDRDGLPNVLMEAASQKLPLISTSVSAIPEFIQHARHGVLASDTPEALAEAIVRLAQDPARRKEYADAAYQRLVDEFGMDSGIDILESRLRNLCAVS